MPVLYSLAPDVRTVAQRLIDKYHPELRAIRIEYVFRSKAARRHNHLVRGTARIERGVHALLATDGAQTSEDLDFFLITIALDQWSLMDTGEREALVDHELSHCRVEYDDEGYAKLVLHGHDIEAFFTEIPRHGLWTGALEEFVTSLPAEQMELLSALPALPVADGVDEPF